MENKHRIRASAVRFKVQYSTSIRLYTVREIALLTFQNLFEVKTSKSNTKDCWGKLTNKIYLKPQQYLKMLYIHPVEALSEKLLKKETLELTFQFNTEVNSALTKGDISIGDSLTANLIPYGGGSNL